MRKLRLVGVDVSDDSIKVLRLGEQNTILAYGATSIPRGVVEGGRILDVDAFGTKLIEVLKHTQPETLYEGDPLLRAVLCIPESKLFTHYVSLPQEIKYSAIESFVRGEAEKIVPYRIEELYFDIHVTESSSGRGAIFIGAPRIDIDNYVEAFARAEVRPALIGGELSALGRALLPEENTDMAHMIVDIGVRTSNIGVFIHGHIAAVSVTVPVGGDYITGRIVESLGIDVSVAESQKREGGLLPNTVYESIPQIIREALEEVVSAITETITHTKTHYGNEVVDIIIAGGTALLPGIENYITQVTGVPAAIANPFAKIQNPEFFDTSTNRIFFGNVVGLALLSNSEQSGVNLLTQYRYSDTNDAAASKEGIMLRDVRSLEDIHYVLYGYIQVFRKKLRFLGFLYRAYIKIDLKLILAIITFLLSVVFLIWVLNVYI